MRRSLWILVLIAPALVLTTLLTKPKAARADLSMTGAQLARPGVSVNLPAAQSGEIVYLSPTSQ